MSETQIESIIRKPNPAARPEYLGPTISLEDVKPTLGNTGVGGFDRYYESHRLGTSDDDLNPVPTENIPYRTIANQPRFTSYSNALELRSRRPTSETTQLMYGSETNPEMFPDGGWDAYLVLFGSFVGLIADFGISNSMGAIESYVSSHQLKDVKSTSISWIFSLHLGVMYLGGVFFGEMFDRLGAKIPLIAGMLTIVTGLLLTAECTTLTHFIICFSILTAFGTSMAMSPLVGAISHWFLKKRALACSIGTTGGLVGASLYPVMLQKLYGQVGFKWALRILALICLFCMMVAVILVKERRQSEPISDSKPSSSNESESKKERGVVKLAVTFFKQALDFSTLRDSRFILLTMAVGLSEISAMTTLTYLSSYAIEHKVSESQAYLLLTIVNISGIPSRLATGFMADVYGRFNIMVVSSFATTLVMFVIWLPGGGSVGALFAFAVLFGISTSAVMSLIPACTGQICSAERFGKVYGTLYFFLGFLLILGMYIASLVIDNGSSSNYRNFVLLEGALAGASVFIWIWARYSAVGWKLCKF